MTTPSQGLRALGSLLETVTPDLSDATQTALAGVSERLHAAADAEAVAEAERIGGAAAGPALAAFATAMVDGFFASLRPAGTRPPGSAPQAA